ncbi:hypothetical protein CYMTET_19015 [Cymbomonas tetramitiformis]|uniref:EF-hand domain-containing protein n=1 Tax=Cymbomonas tetramitiformis TaxID=36881 RepID=A0AAE0G7G0_9CHLO|nr:hypothetical protein CYMTET_40724 [Cymbomonas tetramitiformis]KAK3272700.1 hypothetical protein CYMTET_19015 [Cymbomonas tetramitiformis]
MHDQRVRDMPDFEVISTSVETKQEVSQAKRPITESHTPNMDSRVQRVPRNSKCSKFSLTSTGCRYSKSDVLKLRQVFVKHDIDSDGRVTFDEFQSGLRGTSLEGKDKVSYSMFKKVDRNNDEVLSFKEYLQAYYKHASPQEMKIMMEWAYPKKICGPEIEKEIKELTETFNLFSKHERGRLNRKELTEMGYSAEEVQHFISSYGSENGLLLGEFLEMVKSEYLQHLVPKSPKKSKLDSCSGLASRVP